MNGMTSFNILLDSLMIFLRFAKYIQLYSTVLIHGLFAVNRLNNDCKLDIVTTYAAGSNSISSDVYDP